MAAWDSKQYLKFKNERTQPAIDLAAKIPLQNPKKVIDIGCGPGNSTAVLFNQFPHAAILGVDNSQSMIDAAAKEYPAVEFRLFDAGSDFPLLKEKFDVVFSNACIQWVPEHPKLLKNMMALLNPGGVMAVQIPNNYEEPIHKIIKELSASEKWSSKFNSPRHFHTLGQGEYYDLLTELSSEFTMWQTTYYHKMKSHQDIMEWYRATGLRPYLSALSGADKIEFEQDVLRQAVKRYPVQKNGEIIFRFPRLFFIAVK